MSSCGPRTLALWLAFGVPLLAYVISSAGLSYWLDSGEFVAASVSLDIAHPPGHPLSELYGKAWSLLPLGSLPWRIAIGQAFAGALSALFACLAIQRSIAQLGLELRVQWSLALLGAWVPALAYGMWFQSVRPEVYALQTLCMSFAMERVSRLDTSSGSAADGGALGAAALALGLGLANHHLMAFLVAPAFLPAVVRLYAVRGVRPVLSACGFGLLALGTYVYLPVRAGVPPPVNLGNPSTWENFFWVLSARVYTKNLVFLSVGTPLERMVDMAVLLLQSFHPAVLLAGIVGVYLGLRHEATRRATLTLALVFGIAVGFRAWMGSVLGNPDILGYLGPAFVALGGLVAICAALVFWSAQEHLPAGRRLVAVLALVLPLWALAQAKEVWARASLREFVATDVFDDARVRTLPPRAVVAAGTAQTAFRHIEIETVEVVRPDVTLVPFTFLRYPGTAELLVQRAPHVAALVERYLLRDALPGRVARDLAVSRPVLVEIDARTPPQIFAHLRASHLLHQVYEAPAQRADLDRAAVVQRDRYARLYRSLGTNLSEAETSRQLLWTHFLDALYFAAQGRRDHALDALARAHALHPHDADVVRLSKVLGAARDGEPIDVGPFLHSELTGR